MPSKSDRQQRFYEKCVSVLRDAGYSVVPLRFAVVGPDGRSVECAPETLIAMARKRAQQEARR